MVVYRASFSIDGVSHVPNGRMSLFVSQHSALRVRFISLARPHRERPTYSSLKIVLHRPRIPENHRRDSLIFFLINAFQHLCKDNFSNANTI